MHALLEESNKAYEILKNYKGENSYILQLKRNVFIYKVSTLNKFQIENI